MMNEYYPEKKYGQREQIERNKAIIQMYINGEKLHEIGKRHNITKVRVSQIVKNELIKRRIS